MLSDLDFEPVKIRWNVRTEEERRKKSYWKILEEWQQTAIQLNRPTSHIPEQKKVVYLIDDAQNTYLKSSEKRYPYFVLVCEHGSADMLFHKWGSVLSQGALISLERRIELPQLYLNDHDMKDMVGEWAKRNSPNRICGPDLLDFFRFYTRTVT